MNIRPAQPGDLPALLEIFAHARAFMAQTGNPTQWPATYPGAELMQQQIARGVCYVLEGNARPEATFCYIPGPEPTYAEIYDGGWPDDAPYATIHRMASAGRVHGAAAICFAWCAARGLPLRADTHADNKVMQHLLEKNGFVRCGNITLADGTSRIAYHCTVPPRGGKQQTAAQAAAALAQAAKALPKPADGPLLVALDGRCAAGKTTIAAQMARQYGWGVVHLDDFFLQPIQRTPQRMAEPGGNLNRERLIAEVLEPLRAGQQGSYRLFDCRTMALAPRHCTAAPDADHFVGRFLLLPPGPVELLRLARLCGCGACRAAAPPCCARPGKAGRFQNQMDPQRGNLFCTFPDPGTVRGEGIITARFVRPCRPIKCCQGGDALIPPRKIINGLLCT